MGVKPMTIRFDNFFGEVEERIKKAKRKAESKAVGFMASKIKETAPVGETGNLKKSVRVKKAKGGGYQVGMSRPKGSHAHLVEYGHDMIVNGVKVGTVPPHPFFRPTWDANAGEVEKIMKDTFHAEL
jgi:HK97 gp10 family phage protein